MKVRAYGAFLFAVGCLSANAGAAVIYETGFEASDGYLDLGGGYAYYAYFGDGSTGSLGDGWSVLPTGEHTGVDIVSGWVTPAPDGQWIDLIGTNGPGGIERTLAVHAGYTYTLTWDDFSNRTYDGNATGYAYKVLFGLGTASENVIDATTAWTARSLSFTAASDGMATLRFFSNDTGTGNTGIDNVKIAAVPEPFTLALCAGTLGLALRRRLKKA